jgi:hypothetical protein
VQLARSVGSLRLLQRERTCRLNGRSPARMSIKNPISALKASSLSTVEAGRGRGIRRTRCQSPLNSLDIPPIGDVRAPLSPAMSLAKTCPSFAE